MDKELSTKQQAIGVFGGSFDPIHLGHTHSAKSVAEELNLSQVLLIPAHISPHKNTPELIPHASSQNREHMVKMACEKHSIFHCDSREMIRAGDSFTVETLEALKQEMPDTTLFFIIGFDSLLSFTRWHKYLDILNLCHLVVNTRPHYDQKQLNEETLNLIKARKVEDKTDLKRSSAGAIFFATPVSYDISSTQVRQHIAKKQDCQLLLEPSILEFIHKNKLYR